MKKMIEITDGYCTIRYGGYDYDIALDRIKNQQELLGWVYHLSEKTWMNGERICDFIDAIITHKRWAISYS